MSLAKLQEGLKKFTEDDKSYDVISYVNDFIDEQQKTYTQNKENRCISFGKFKGSSMEDMSKTTTGKSYIQWLLKQSWFTEEKFQDLYEDMRTFGLLKKI